jgi:UDP-N-acetylglucosamine:LPS N-acetylglucosamine transferase
VLLLWATTERGIYSSGRTLGGILAGPPHRLEVVQVDLPDALAVPRVVTRVAGRIAGRLEAAVVASLGWPEVASRLDRLRPRVVVAMDPVAAAAADTWRGKGLLRAPLLGVVPGLWFDPAWARTAVDRLSVADETQAEKALELGLPAECLVPCGIMVCGGFSSIAESEKERLRERFDLPADRPLVLVVTDGLDPDALTGALFQLSMVADRAALLFDVAQDDDAADLLRRRSGLYGVQARMFGKVEEAGELWAAADLVVARPHLYVEQRVVANRLPLVSLLPADERERQVASIFRERGVGRVVEHLSTLAAEVEMMLAPPTLESARQTLVRISKRRASEEVARLVAQVHAQSEEILAEARHRLAREKPWPAKSDAAAAKSDAADEKARAEKPLRRGPLEFIGGAPKQTAGPGEEHLAGASTLADLEAAETEAGRQVLEHQDEAGRWQGRAQLAEERGEKDLRVEAERMADRHRTAMHRALDELAHLARRRTALGGKEGHDRLEHTFRRLEVEQALNDLKRKMGWKE